MVISGRMVSKDGLSNTKSIFMLVKDGETTYCNVEELVRDHYKVRNYGSKVAKYPRIAQ